MKFLVDVNLPKYFNFFNKPGFIFVVDINEKMSDKEIWDYALKNELIIVTKDSDFYSKILLSNKSPKVIHLKTGNKTLKELNEYFEKNWNTILNVIENAKMIIAYENNIEIIN